MTNKTIPDSLTIEEKDKLNNFFKNSLGISLDEVIGYSSIIKKDVRAFMTVKPEHHYPMEYPVVIKKGAQIKIENFGKFGLQPLGYSNDFGIKILNPQVELGELIIQMEDLIEGIK